MCKLHGVRLIKGTKIFESMLKNQNLSSLTKHRHKTAKSMPDSVTRATPIKRQMNRLSAKLITVSSPSLYLLLCILGLHMTSFRVIGRHLG